MQLLSTSGLELVSVFIGLSVGQVGKLVTAVRRHGGPQVADDRPGRPWRLDLADRVLLVAVYYRTNLTMRQLAPLFGVSPAGAHRVIDRLGPHLALAPARRPGTAEVLIVDGTLVPAQDRQVAASAKHDRHAVTRQVLIHADTRLVLAVGRAAAGPPQRRHRLCRLRGEPNNGGRHGARRGRLPGAPACSSGTAASPARLNCRPGRRNTTPATDRCGPGSRTSSLG